jgi:hypothetical protein
MSVSSISSGTNAFQSQLQQIRKDFTTLQTDLSSSNLSGAQQAYSALTQDLQGVNQSQSGQQASGTSQLSNDLAAVGSALQSNDLSGAQSAFTQLTQDLQSAEQTQVQQAQAGQQVYGHHHHHHHHGDSSQTASTTVTNDLTALGNALQSGNVANAQSAFTTLMNDLGSSTQNATGTTATTANTQAVGSNISLTV